jgi:hypothetical protein
MHVPSPANRSSKLWEYILRRGGFWSCVRPHAFSGKKDGSKFQVWFRRHKKLVASQQARNPRDRPRDPPSIVFCRPLHYVSPDRLVFEVDEREPLPQAYGHDVGFLLFLDTPRRRKLAGVNHAPGNRRGLRGPVACPCGRTSSSGDSRCKLNHLMVNG